MCPPCRLCRDNACCCALGGVTAGLDCRTALGPAERTAPRVQPGTRRGCRVLPGPGGLRGPTPCPPGDATPPARSPGAGERPREQEVGPAMPTLGREKGYRRSARSAWPCSLRCGPMGFIDLRWPPPPDAQALTLMVSCGPQAITPRNSKKPALWAVNSTDLLGSTLIIS